MFFFYIIVVIAGEGVGIEWPLNIVLVIRDIVNGSKNVRSCAIRLACELLSLKLGFYVYEQNRARADI